MPATAASRLGKKVGRCMVSPCCSMVKDLCTAYDGGAGPGAVGRPPHPAAGGAPSGGTGAGRRTAGEAPSVGPTQSPRPRHTADSPGQGQPDVHWQDARTLTSPRRAGRSPAVSRVGGSSLGPFASAGTDNALYRPGRLVNETECPLSAPPTPRSAKPTAAQIGSGRATLMLLNTF